MGSGTGGEGEPLQATVSVQIQRDGTVLISAPHVDAGSENQTRLTQIAAESLMAPFEAVRFLNTDTIQLPAPGTITSPVSIILTGNALLNATLPIRQKILEQVAREWSCGVDELISKPGMIIGPQQRVCSFAQAVELCWLQGVPMARYCVEKMTPYPKQHDKSLQFSEPIDNFYYHAYSYAACMAEVEIDVESYEIEKINLYIACDLGTILNPRLAKSDIIRDACRGIEYMLFTRNNTSYEQQASLSRLPHLLYTLHNLPSIHPILIERPCIHGPLGHKGLGGIPIIGVVPAITNAISHAVNQPIQELPVSPEDLFLLVGTDDILAGSE
jgi:CO/xanthine dehydrogenase Mo-binding subunit